MKGEREKEPTFPREGGFSQAALKELIPPHPCFVERSKGPPSLRSTMGGREGEAKVEGEMAGGGRNGEKAGLGGVPEVGDVLCRPSLCSLSSWLGKERYWR